MVAGHGFVMVVEDDAPMRNVLVDLLALEGVGDAVHSFANGAEALAFLEEGALSEAVVICDVAMPQMSGLEFYERIHRQKPGLKFVFMTAYDLLQAQRRFLEREGLHLLEKPFTLEELTDAVQRVAQEGGDL